MSEHLIIHLGWMLTACYCATRLSHGVPSFLNHSPRRSFADMLKGVYSKARNIPTATSTNDLPDKDEETPLTETRGWMGVRE